MSFTLRLRRKLLGATAVEVGDWLAGVPWRLWSPLRKRLAPAPQGVRVDVPSAFDAAYGVETAGQVSWLDLKVGTESDAFAGDYMATPPAAARLVLDRLDDVASKTFVDVGCGKGRALILASERPFRAVVGIERSPILVDVARQNAALVAARFPDRPAIAVVQADAADPPWPPGDLVLWLFNPFMRPVMEQLVAALERSLRGAPRHVTVLYLHPVCADVLDRCPLLVPDPTLCLSLGRDDDWSRPWQVAAWRSKAG
ncbi:MAG: class I SAM-dependent methyltransferase [Deltaproteobacteria bacterium]|nr:class I SAM-dependent methyltransferase [Deltaproteobacteria bacterium]